MNRLKFHHIVLTILVLLLTGSPTRSALERPMPDRVEFPRQWVNGGPYQADGLRGKLVVLWFFEKGSATGNNKLRELEQFAEKYKDKPIIVFAVSSGTTMVELENMAKSMKLSIPIIADQSRSFEGLSKIGRISSRNIYQMRIVSPEGRMEHANWINPAQSLDRYMDKLAWKIDPQTVPAPLEPLWREIEFGRYSNAYRSLKQAANRANLKEAAAILIQQIETDLQARLAEAQKAETTDKWLAFKRYRSITEDFAGVPGLDDARNKGKLLSNDEEIKKQLQAESAFLRASALVASNKQSEREMAMRALREMPQRFPATQGAELATIAIEALEAS